MAGFIISVSKETNLEELISNGMYSSIVPHELNSSKGKIIAYSTLADYLSMTDSDDIYFLKERKIYGVGRVIQLNGKCCFENFPNSTDLNYRVDSINTIDESNNSDARWVCFFRPNPNFFKIGVDMDDVLLYKPSSFRMLRAFQDRTFIKIDDEENRALKEFIYLRNKNNQAYFNFKYEKFEKTIQFNYKDYEIDINLLIKNNISEAKNALNLEMLLETVMLDLINRNGIFGEKWDYVTHQVIASPFKPLSYIDKMDIFAYKYLEFPQEVKPIEKYLVLELKKGKATMDTIQQVMRYVDWICKEYASGDYSLVKAGVIASDYGDLDSIESIISRTFILSTHPIKTEEWNDMTCLKYSISDNQELQLKEYKYFNKVKYVENELSHLDIQYDTKKFTKKGIKMKPNIYNKEYKFAFVDENQKDTIRILSEDGWYVFILKENDTEQDIQLKINNIIKVKSST